MGNSRPTFFFKLCKLFHLGAGVLWELLPGFSQSCYSVQTQMAHTGGWHSFGVGDLDPALFSCVSDVFPLLNFILIDEGAERE